MTDYNVYNPTGNITILAPMPADSMCLKEIADALMKKESEAEQVGFTYKCKDADIGLMMAGGEFCGNATLCAAAMVCEGFSGSGIKDIRVKVSGASEIADVQIKKTGDNLFVGSVKMPQAISVSKKTLRFDGKKFIFPVVEFCGISHIICQEDMNESFAQKAVRKWCSDLSADALGIMFLNAEKKSIKPLVFVKASDTLFWESSCASGSAAAALFLSREEKKAAEYEFTEPAGILKVRIQSDGDIVLTGSIQKIK